MGCPTLQKVQALGTFAAMLEASLLIPPFSSLCDSPKGNLTPPGNIPEAFLSRPENILTSDSTSGVFKSWVPRQFQSCIVSTPP